MKVSILIPSRNGVEFLEWSYNSIRKNQGNHTVEILVLDDISDKDNTWDWCVKVMKDDPLFKAFRNTSSVRLGISGGHKFLSEKATMEVICHWHNDMYLTETALDQVHEQLYITIPDLDPENIGPRAMTPIGILPLTSIVNENVCVCLTRIEPGMNYQPGPEKVVWNNAPVEFDEWNEDLFLQDLPNLKLEWNEKVTGGHFAPYFIGTKIYRELGSNDIKTFPFQSREDSDFGFRLVLAGIKTIQIPAFVFHFASRGNRRNKYETNTLKDNPDWINHNVKATRNFIRKWQTLQLHDNLLTPTPPKRYEISFIVTNCTNSYLELLEPWCDYMITDISDWAKIQYIEREQNNTMFDLEKKFGSLVYPQLSNIGVEIDCNKFNQQDFNSIQNISALATEANKIGKYEVGNLKIHINKLNSYENKLINPESDYLNSKLLHREYE